MTYSVPLAQIPITPAQNQSLAINLNGTDYRLRLMWNDEANDGSGTWMMDIGDGQGVPIVCGIPLVAGVNLLGQYEYLQIGRGGAMFLFGVNHSTESPTFYNLGSEWQLYFGFPTSFGGSVLPGLTTVPQSVLDALARPPLPANVTLG